MTDDLITETLLNVLICSSDSENNNSNNNNAEMVVYIKINNINYYDTPAVILMCNSDIYVFCDG